VGVARTRCKQEDYVTMNTEVYYARLGIRFFWLGIGMSGGILWKQ
jgi:hypothetical protein